MQAPFVSLAEISSPVEGFNRAGLMPKNGCEHAPGLIEFMPGIAVMRMEPTE